MASRPQKKNEDVRTVGDPFKMFRDDLPRMENDLHRIMSNMQQDPEPTTPFERFVFHYSNFMRESGDDQGRAVVKVLKSDAQWMADEVRRLRANVNN